VIEKNIPEYFAVFSMAVCSKKGIHICNFLVYNAYETEQSSAIECTRRALPIQDDLFNKRIMKCFVDFDKTNYTDSGEKYYSTKTELQIFMN
jgi:hypothetical protein